MYAIKSLVGPSIVCLLLVVSYAGLGNSANVPFHRDGLSGANVYYHVPAGMVVRGEPYFWRRHQTLQPVVAVASGGPSSYSLAGTEGVRVGNQPPESVSGTTSSVGANGCQCNRLNATAEKIATMLEKLRQMLPFKQTGESINPTTVASILSTSTSVTAASPTASSTTAGVTMASPTVSSTTAGFTMASPTVSSTTASVAITSPAASSTTASVTTASPTSSNTVEDGARSMWDSASSFDGASATSTTLLPTV